MPKFKEMMSEINNVLIAKMFQYVQEDQSDEEEIVSDSEEDEFSI